MDNPGCKGKAETQTSRSLWIRKRDILDMSTMGSSNKLPVGTQTQGVHCVPGNTNERRAMQRNKLANI